MKEYTKRNWKSDDPKIAMSIYTDCNYMNSFYFLVNEKSFVKDFETLVFNKLVRWKDVSQYNEFGTIKEIYKNNHKRKIPYSECERNILVGKIDYEYKKEIIINAINKYAISFLKLNADCYLFMVPVSCQVDNLGSISVLDFNKYESFGITTRLINEMDSISEDLLPGIAKEALDLCFYKVVFVDTIEKYLMQINRSQAFKFIEIIDKTLLVLDKEIEINESIININSKYKEGSLSKIIIFNTKQEIETIKQYEEDLKTQERFFKRAASGAAFNDSTIMQMHILKTYQILDNAYDHYVKNMAFSNNTALMDFRPFARSKALFYRGVTRIIYPEQPKIFRDNTHFYREEADSYREFSIHCLTGKKETCLENLTEMQHYYLSTRLLDITSNPLVALYMACTVEFGNENDIDMPGEIITYFPQYVTDNSELKYFDSDRVKMLSLLSLLEYKEKHYLFELLNKYKDKDDDFKQLIKKVLLTEDLNEEENALFCILNSSFSHVKEACKAYSKLNKLMVEEKKSFDISEFNPFDLLQSYYVKVGFINERISAQAGSFIIFGLDKNYAIKNLVNTRNNKSLTRTIIVNKRGILSQLETLNISQKTLMPDKDHIAKQITKNTK